MKIFTFFIQLLYAQQNTESEKQPNIVYILADDLGWADVNWNNKLGLQILFTISLSSLSPERPKITRPDSIFSLKCRGLVDVVFVPS